MKKKAIGQAERSYQLKLLKFRKQQKDTENHLLQTLIRFRNTQMLHTMYTINSCQWRNVKFVVSIIRARTETPYISNTRYSQCDIL